MDFQPARAEVFSIVGRIESPRHSHEKRKRDGQRGPVVAIYDYVHAEGRLLHQVIRHRDPKEFRQRRPDGRGGWIYDLQGVETVLYNLPAVIAAEKVYVAEGEEDCLALGRLGLVATTNPMGAGKFRPEMARYLAGKHIVILPDNDGAGRKHGEQVARMLAPAAASVRVLHLPGLAEKGDISDWIAAGGTEAELRALVRSAPLWAPAAEPEPEERSSDRQPTASVAMPKLLSAADLYSNEPAALRPLIMDATRLKGLLWDGLTLLFAKPKAGKSWLALQMSIAVAGGPDIAGLSVAEIGPVVYVALEEPAARTSKRMKMLARPGDWCKNLHFLYDLLPLMGGGAEQLEAVIAGVKPRLLVIDTLTAAIKGGGSKNGDVFRSQYAEVARVRKIAEDFHLSVLLIHHSRKGGSSDGAVEAVAGTGGVAAACDCLYYLKRKPESEGTLEIIGREAEESTWALRLAQNPFGWEFLGDDAENHLTGERKELLAVLRDDGPMTPAAIAMELAKPRPAVRMLLKRMLADNQVRKVAGKYHPSLSESYRVTERKKESENE